MIFKNVRIYVLFDAFDQRCQEANRILDGQSRFLDHLKTLFESLVLALDNNTMSMTSKSSNFIKYLVLVVAVFVVVFVRHEITVVFIDIGVAKHSNLTLPIGIQGELR